ncbi:MAG: hypothetical protein KDA66_07530 [Planctomycetaceae bacterium]|nr:hypothetical protein [Planctomycetaceae bacterium]
MLNRYLPLIACVCCLGCGGSSPEPATPPTESTTQQDSPATSDVTPEQSPAAATPVATPPQEMPVSIPSISLSGTPSSGNSNVSPAGATSSGAGTPTAGSVLRKQVLAAMDPLQIMLGSWRGTTQKPVGDFKGLDEPEWVWDFKTNRDHPSMVMKSNESNYFREARLTYLPDREIYQMKTTGPDGAERVYEGTFEVPVEKYQGDDDRMHVKYKLALAQTNGTTPRDTWQVIFNQQENNRYLMELGRQQSDRFLRFDTVATQRQGTSFAKSDDDYGDRECIISGGLGTSQVSYNGKSYWVCCSGCKAAFDEDPETWIAEYEAKQKAKQ